MEQNAPDPADQFKSVKFIVCTLRVKFIKSVKEFQEHLMSFLIMVKEKAKDRGVKNGQHGFLINISKHRGRGEKARGNGKNKDLRPVPQLAVTVKHTGVDKKAVPGFQTSFYLRSRVAVHKIFQFPFEHQPELKFRMPVTLHRTVRKIIQRIADARNGKASFRIAKTLLSCIVHFNFSAAHKQVSLNWHNLISF